MNHGEKNREEKMYKEVSCIINTTANSMYGNLLNWHNFYSKTFVYKMCCYIRFSNVSFNV